MVLSLLATLPGQSQAADPFDWQSVSFDGGIDPILAGSINGVINGVNVPSSQMSALENTGMDFHIRWNSQVLTHLGLRFSVGYTAFSPSMGFHGLSAMPLTVGVTVPYYDPRVAENTFIPYLAFDLGPSFNSLPANQGNVGSVSFTADFGVGVLYTFSDRLSFYGEVLPTLIQDPISSTDPQTRTNVSTSVMWTLPVLLGITYNFLVPQHS